MSHLHDYAPPSDGFLDGAQQWADGKIHGAYKSAFKGLLHVAATGFGKGAIATAIIAAGVMAVLAFTAAPTVAAATVFSSVLSASATYFTSGAGLALLGGGGLLGAALSAHGEHKRLNTQQAEEMAQYYEVVREKSVLAQAKTPKLAVEQDECRSGHCEKLLHERQKLAHAAQQVAR